jgi:hypothetical protein
VVWASVTPVASALHTAMDVTIDFMARMGFFLVGRRRQWRKAEVRGRSRTSVFGDAG